MAALGEWADGLEYPMTKADLIDAAEEAGASEDLLARLQRLESEHYDGPEEVERELREQD